MVMKHREGARFKGIGACLQLQSKIRLQIEVTIERGDKQE